MTLPRLYALQKHWKSFPPVHITAALFAGIKPPDEIAPDAVSMPNANVWDLVREIDDGNLASMNIGAVARAPRMPHG